MGIRIKIKLPKDKNSNFESMVLPNYRYTLNITIQGSVSAAGGVITSYSAYPFFSRGNLGAWQNKGPEDMNLKYEGN